MENVVLVTNVSKYSYIQIVHLFRNFQNKLSIEEVTVNSMFNDTFFVCHRAEMKSLLHAIMTATTSHMDKIR